MKRWRKEKLSSGFGEDEKIARSEEDSSDSGEDQARSKQDVRSLIWSTLNKIKTPVAYAFSAVNSYLPNPGLHLVGHRLIGLPLSPDDAQKIISAASSSPFGQKEETLVNVSVRRWELNPTKFCVKNAEWSKALESIVGKVCEGFGILNETKNISVELKKLILYEQGSFLLNHKDSQKGANTFATLIICLPSKHEGGKLILTNDGEKFEFETAVSSKYSISYVAWYADIDHEVRPITSGYRLILVYNLNWQSEFVVPSYNLDRGHVVQLSTLLQRYNEQLGKGENELPPFLLHKLKHKYTQDNLQFSSLESEDVAQVQSLSQLSTKFGFCIYLATLELKVVKYDGDDKKSKSYRLENIVDLDGKLLVRNLDYPKGALIDPKPQNPRKADKVKHDDWSKTGIDGITATSLYRDTVVIILPNLKQLEFVFQFSSQGKTIEPLFSKLIETFSEDLAQKPNLKKLCELALNQRPSSGTVDEYSQTIPPFFKQAAVTALELGLFELFDEASRRTKDKIMLELDIPGTLGRCAAKEGLDSMKDRLMKGVSIAPSIAEKVKFLQLVKNGFEASLQGPGSPERADLKQWSDEVLFSSISHLAELSKADGVSLGQLNKTIDWNLFKSNSMKIIGRAQTIVKIAFTNEVLSSLQDELNEEQRAFIKDIILSIWKDFAFDSKGIRLKIVASTKQNLVANPVIKSEVNGHDLNLIVENSIRVVSPQYIETVVIPAMMSAIPETSKECSNKLFIDLVRMILKDELAGFTLPTSDSVPSTLHKRFVQALLTKFLLNEVGVEPQPPTTWALPAGPCNCNDCAVVNEFLKNPNKKTFDFRFSGKRRLHLYKEFTDCRWDSRKIVRGTDYDVQTIDEGSPYIWRIIKHRRRHKAEMSKLSQNTKAAIKSLGKLKNDEPVNCKLELYLQPYYNIIMEANFQELPSLKIFAVTRQASNNSCPAHNRRIDQAGEIGPKRSADDIDPQNYATAKRTRV